MPLTFPCQSSVKPGIDFNSPEPSTLYWNASGRDGKNISHASTPKMSKHLVGIGSSSNPSVPDQNLVICILILMVFHLLPTNFFSFISLQQCYIPLRVQCQSMRLKSLMYPKKGAVSAVLEAKEERKTKDRNVKFLYDRQIEADLV
jgi:hypothetical protein